MTPAPRHTESRHRRPGGRRAPLSPLTVVGELLLLGGLATFGYIVWQPWHTGTTVVQHQRDLALEEAKRWAEEAAQAEPVDPGTVPPVAQPEALETFGNLYVPAFGVDYANLIAESTDIYGVLNNSDLGIGHYDETQLPGEAGNFVLAGHRSGPFINSFREIMNLRLGDPMFVQTAQGWYTYRFRSVEYVWPDQVEVLNPFPHLDGVPGDDMILTLTTCHPKWAGTDERAIGYAVFESYQSLADGPPAELLELNPDFSEGVQS